LYADPSGSERLRKGYLDGTRCSVLEADAMETLVEIDGVLPGHHFACKKANQLAI
jgi:hypothetical protein